MRRWAGLIVLALGMAGCGTAGSPTAGTATPEAVTAGEVAFNASCAECHGVAAAGTDQGPPLVDDIYRSSHHADVAFSLAVTRGVPQHHWSFGSMEAVDGLSDADVTNIVAYVRSLQREAGIE